MPTPYESILLSSTPIAAPNPSPHANIPSLTAQYQKRPRPFSAREYVEAQKALLKARQSRESMMERGVSGSSDGRISSSRREFNRQRELKAPGALRYDPFEEELEKDGIMQERYKEQLPVPHHLNVLSHHRNVSVREVEEQKAPPLPKNATGAATAPLDPVQIKPPKKIIKPLSQIAQYEHSPSVVKSQMMLAMQEHAANPRMWVRSVLGATLERGFYEIPKVELAPDPLTSNLDEDHAEFLQIFEGEDEETYEDFDLYGEEGYAVAEDKSSVRFSVPSGGASRGGASREGASRGSTRFTSYGDDLPTTQTGALSINQRLNIVTKPYASIPKLDPNIELVRIESKRDDSSLMKHSLFGEKRRKTFFDTDSERGDEESIHTGMDSDFMQSSSNNSNAAGTALDALRRTSINSPTVKFDLKDSYPSGVHKHRGGLVDDFKYTPQSTKTLETQFDDLNLGKDLEEVVANIWAAPDRANEIAESHKSLIESSVALRYEQEKARDQKESMEEYEAMLRQLKRISEDEDDY